MKMCLTLLFLFIFLNAKAQFNFIDSCVQFTLHIKIDNPYSDTIRYGYADCLIDSEPYFVLKNGEATVAGNINRASEMILFCNKNAPAEDSSFYRLILESGEIFLHLTMKGPSIVKDVITGDATAQNEKRNWERQYKVLFQLREKLFSEYEDFIKSKVSGMDSAERNKALIEYLSKIDIIKECIAFTALDFINEHKTSHSSANLLLRYRRRFSVDTLMNCFNQLPANVQQSSMGKLILEEAFNRSSSWEMFAPYMSQALWQNLKNFKTIYNVSLPDANNKSISFAKYKNKIILLDLWASWCRPCIAAMPSLYQLKKDLKDYPVEIISVSIDNNEQDWKTAIEKYNLKGTHLLDKEGLFAAYYHVLGVPKYIIIDENGKTVNENAPKPNNGQELKDILINLSSKQR